MDFTKINKCYWYEFSFFSMLEYRLENTGIKNIRDYIGVSATKKIPNHIGDGITFKYKNNKSYNELFNQLEKNSSYAKDDRSNFFGAWALKATKGDGFRSIGKPSVHFNISPTECNIHLDEHGFVLRSSDGSTFYSPDLCKHIFDELLIPMLGTRRIETILPYSGNNYKGQFGLNVILVDKKTFDTSLKFTVGAYLESSPFTYDFDAERLGVKKPKFGLTANLTYRWR